MILLQKRKAIGIKWNRQISEKRVFMPDQKLDNLLNLAMDATPQERAKSENLNVGYDSTTRLWDVIVKYSEPERGLGGDGIQVVPLLGGYAVVTLPETELDAYSDREQVEFIEKPKRLYFETFEGREASCILPVQAELNGLTGEGILVGIVDSGVDYFHPDFRNEDGSSRILRLWDQSVNGNPPESYVTGTEYTKEEIDKALALEETEGRRLVPVQGFQWTWYCSSWNCSGKWESIRWSELWCCV